MTDVTIFEEKHMLSTLLYLLEEGRARKIDIYHAVSPNPRMPDKLVKLEGAGLIEHRVGSEPHSPVWISLTEKGQAVAECIKVIGEVME